MKNFHIKKILVPTDFSETGLLAVEHAAFMANLFKAELHILHVIEVSKFTYDIYNPAAEIRDLGQIEKIVSDKLAELDEKIRKDYGVQPETLSANGKISAEVSAIVKENSIDLVIMGTHGASGFEEYFIGSNAHKVITTVPCPVITIQTHAKKIGFNIIVMPIDNTPHSRQKVDYVLELGRHYHSTIHILGLPDSKEVTDMKKFAIKLDAVEETVKKAGLQYVRKTVEGKNLAEKAIDYSNYVDADLLIIMTDHESQMTGMFMGAFAKQIVNHSKIPVMSIKPLEGQYESLDLAAASPF